MSSSRKIAILLPNLRAGGAERMRVHMAREWLCRGIDVDFVLCQKQGELLSQVPHGARLVDLHAPKVRNAVFPLARYLHCEKPNVLLAAMWPLTAIAPLAMILSGLKASVAISEHAPLSLGYASWGKIHRFALRSSTALSYRLSSIRIAVSSGVADDMAMLSCMPRSSFTVIYNPAGSKHEQGPRAHPAMLESVRGSLIISVGTLAPVKRHDLLIDAFARIASRMDATLCILGEGTERGALESQIQRLGLLGRVLLAGYVADPSLWYARANLFALTSDHEGFGNVIVEALDHGVPVVSTDCPSGPREILQDGKYGTLVPVGDVDALAQAMLASLHTTHDHAAMKARARDFAVDTIADQYLDHLLPGWRGHMPESTP